MTGYLSDRALPALRAMLAMQRHPWEQGTCAQALYEADLPEYWLPMAHEAAVRRSRDGRLAMLGGGAAVSDPASAGEVCLRAAEQTGDPLCRAGADGMLDYLLHRAPRTPEGIICHNEISHEPGFTPFQLWIDGAYMVPPFLAVMGCLDEAARQLQGYADALLDPETGVFFHIYDAGGKRFVRRRRWATGNGWALMGIARVADAAAAAGRADLRDTFNALGRRVLDAMLRCQLPDGRFHDILDDSASFVDGTSAMMVSAVIFRRVLGGTLPEAYAERAELAYRTVLARMDAIGLIHEVAGCPDFAHEGTSAEAQAAFLMADAWRNRLAGKRAPLSDGA